MTNWGSVPDWIAAAGALVTAAFAAPATVAFLRDRNAAKAARLTLKPEGAYLHIVYRADTAELALRAKVEVVRGAITLSDNPNGVTIYDPATSIARPNPDFRGERTVEVDLERSYEDSLSFRKVLAIVGPFGAGATLRVTVTSKPSGRRVFFTQRPISG